MRVDDAKNSERPDGLASASAVADSLPPADGHESVCTPVVSDSAHRASIRRSVGMPPVKGDFRPLRQLGSGSFGEVWLAEEWVDGHLWRLVAVKFLHPDQEGAAAALFQEVEKLGRLTRKRGIVDVYHFEVEGERPYFTMDYASEGSLAGLLTRERRLPVSRAATIFRQIAEALESLHFKGIIHCDLKPENVLLNDHFEPMLADFGQARLIGKGPPNTGSWFYMAPEQLASNDRDAETSCNI